MATAKSTRAPRGRSSQPSDRIPAAVLQHISVEVGLLYKGSALLNVLQKSVVGEALDVIEIASELIGQAIDGLDEVALSAAVGKRGAR